MFENLCHVQVIILVQSFKFKFIHSEKAKKFEKKIFQFYFTLKNYLAFFCGHPGIIELRRRQYFKLLLDPGNFHSNPSGFLFFNKSETVLWTIAKNIINEINCWKLIFSKLFLFPVTKAIILQWQQPMFNTYNLTKMASERNVGNACYHSRYDANLKFLK